MSTLSNALLHKILALLTLTETVLDVFVTTIITFLSNYYGDLYIMVRIFHIDVMKCWHMLRTLIVPGPSVLNPLIYITCIFKDTSDYIYIFWEINKCKKVMEFINTICVYDLYFI